GKKNCEDRGMTLPVVRNGADNSAIAKVLNADNSPAWIDQSMDDGRWGVDTKEKIVSSRWFFGAGPPSLKCTVNQAVTIAGSKIDKCVKLAGWETSNHKAKNTVICVRPA
ncbi:hypothetical protein PFISCL1PPCAC_3680, partial [Pristionchus fissidentatus]